MKTTLLVLGALACVAARPVSAASAPCDRECLRGTMTTFLYALVRHDASRVPVADKVRVTEDAIEKPLAKIGLLNSVTRLRGFRQDILDERAGMAGADVVVEEVGAPVMLVVRLKVVDRKITEIETVATGGGGGLLDEHETTTSARDAPKIPSCPPRTLVTWSMHSRWRSRRRSRTPRCCASSTAAWA